MDEESSDFSIPECPEKSREKIEVLKYEINSEINQEQSSPENGSKENSDRSSKPFRPCLYCGVFQAQLNRHLKTVHKNEKEIKEIMSLPKQRLQEFNQLRKEGISLHNKKILL